LLEDEEPPTRGNVCRSDIGGELRHTSPEESRLFVLEIWLVGGSGEIGQTTLPEQLPARRPQQSERL
jgi:hypothetical protein